MRSNAASETLFSLQHNHFPIISNPQVDGYAEKFPVQERMNAQTCMLLRVKRTGAAADQPGHTYGSKFPVAIEEST